MTPEELYAKGYSEGSNGISANASLVGDENYRTGYEDGKGDLEVKMVKKSVPRPFINENYSNEREPPEGYEWGPYRVPQKGEIYLTKKGNPGVAKTDPVNNRKRHLLYAFVPCGQRAYLTENNVCKFAKGHRSRHSYDSLLD